MSRPIDRLVAETRRLAGLGHGQPAQVLTLSRPGDEWTVLGVVPVVEEPEEGAGGPATVSSGTQTPTLTLRLRRLPPPQNAAGTRRDREVQTDPVQRSVGTQSESPESGRQ